MSEHDDIQEIPEGAERRPSHSRYQHVARAVCETPWAIHPATLAVIVDMVSYRASGHRLTKAEVDERIGEGQMAAAASRRGSMGAQGAVAVLPIWGIIAPRAAAFESVSSPGGTGVDAFTQAFRAALADPAVGSILLEIDSPGGQVGQVPELAAEIRAARGKKPIVALANGMAASAAYWLASQADEVVVTPSGKVGSIGVYLAHEDVSAALEQEGVKVTLISAGKFKTEGNPFEPLSADALEAFQADVDAFYGMFVADVAKGRGVDVGAVSGGFGEGRMVMAHQAVASGLADRVATFDETVARMASGGVQARGVRAETFAASEPQEIDGESAVGEDPHPGPVAEHTARPVADRLDLAFGL